MKSTTRLGLVAAALAAAGTTFAAPFDSADQARREQNREEVLAKHGVSPASYRSGDYRAAEESSSAKASVRETTHHAAQATRNFGHRTADKMRDFGARQDAKFDHKATPQKDPYKHGPQ
ncbi:MAG: hypothetical protein K8R60_06130 [Burkholderiales bacterium]|nr:hypothetical protein [Burkholderiales bacterium]